MKTLLWLLIFSTSVIAYSPPAGIPVPAWGSFDPVNAARPAQPGAWPASEAAGYYYIDNTHPSATNTANTYGYPNLPRLTIPETGFAAGSVVFIAGGPYTWQSGDEELDLSFSGTEANPCWFMAADTGSPPELRGFIEVSGTYAVMDHLLITRDNTVGVGKGPGVHFGGDTDSGTSFICFRNSTCTGDGTFHTGFGSCLNMSGGSGDEVNNIIIYNTTVSELDDYDYSVGTAEDDNHAILPGQYTNTVWVLKCNLFNNSGDGMQISGNNSLGAARSQYIYVGDCVMHTNAENAIDIKSGLDVVIASNTFYNYVDSMGSDGTAIVVQQEGGDGSDHIWIIHNTFYNCRRTVRTEEVATNCYILGNLMRDNGEAGLSAIYSRTPSADLFLIDNTIEGTAGSVVGWDGQAGNAPEIVLHGNIMSGKATAEYFLDGDATTMSGTANRNLYDSSDAFRVIWENATYTSFATFQSSESQEANGVNDAPGFAAASGNNFNLISSSAAIGASSEHAAYDTFTSRYSLNIQIDRNGNSRPQGGSWDIGAFEYVPLAPRSATLRRAAATQ